MSAPLAKDQFAFELPNLTYVDSHLEDPVLPPLFETEKPHGVRRWLAGFRAWRENRAALAEMDMMSDRELADIGLTRSDLPRVFNDNFNGDLRQRDAA
ncbi:MAG TPA: DUF1127 domain-containing protein [Acetobacteraceae bacterium]|jgi:uncharacterized protein YjiS (DUF1127 family)